MKKYSIDIIITLTLLTITITNNSAAQNYQLVWADEFDSTTISTNEWVYEVNGDGGGNSELQYYTSRTQNSSIQNGSFVLMALKENYLGKSYTSARLHTKKSWLFGKIEARIKLPYGKGIWPAFWMLGSNITSVSWPKCGEIDIMEMIGGTTTTTGGDGRTFGTGHWANASGAHVSSGSSKAIAAGKLSDNFHDFSVQWDAAKIIWSLDGFPYYVLDISPVGLAAFRAPFFIIINLAVGGNWPGSPDATTIFPQTMEIDYIRVYQDIPTSVQYQSESVNSFSLLQNYPNPFNPTTIISYQLPTTNRVSLNVYDVLGRDVATLVDEVKEAGNYSETFDAAKLSSGMYFAKLQSGDKVQMMKMSFLK